MCTPRNVAAFTVFGWRYAAYGSAVTQPAAHSDNLRNKTRPDDFISPRPSNSFSGFAFQLVAASIYSQILFLATAIFCSQNKKKSGKFYLVLERSGLHATLETETMMTFSPRITVTSVHVDYKSKKLFANVPPKKKIGTKKSQRALHVPGAPQMNRQQQMFIHFPRLMNAADPISVIDPRNAPSTCEKR